jgi:hypothetical protein
MTELYVGRTLVSGDTVITGSDGSAEFEYPGGSRISVAPETVFSIRERSVQGRTQSAVSATLGKLSFVFSQMAGAEPDIITPQAACGIRGAALTVYTAADGSSLIVVESGAVEVEALGETLLLGPSEGVEFRAGARAGEPFSTLSGVIDYSDWNGRLTETMLSDPLPALGAMEAQLGGLLDRMELFYQDFLERQGEIRRRLDHEEELRRQGRTGEAEEYYREEVRSLELENFDAIINVRFYALSALSFRRHVLTGLYVRLKTLSLGASPVPGYPAFLTAYRRLIGDYETRVSPHLVQADI